MLRWKCDRQFKEVLSGFCESNPPLKQDGEFICYVLRYWMDPKNLEVLEIILNIHRADLVYNAFTNYGPILISYMENRGLHLQDADSRYVIAIRAGYFLGIMAAWMEGVKKETPEEATAYVVRQRLDTFHARMVFQASEDSIFRRLFCAEQDAENDDDAAGCTGGRD